MRQHSNIALEFYYVVRAVTTIISVTLIASGLSIIHARTRP